MKILQLAYSLSNGGAEKFIVELSNELSIDHNVFLCTYRNNETWMLPSKKLSKNVSNLSLNIKNKKSIKNWLAPFMLIYRKKPDIVHVHSSLVIIYLYLLPLFFPRIRFIHTIHNSVTPGYRKLFNLMSILPYIHKRWIHICISPNIFKEFKYAYPVFTFAHVDNGITQLRISDEFKQAREEVFKIQNNLDSILLIAIGNYSDFKRFDLLMEVMNHFEHQGKQLLLIVLGEDASPMQLNYKKVLAKKGPNSYLLGLKAHVGDYLALSDALILSSSMEGMPLVILEAFSLGKPVIASPAGGVCDMVTEGINGYIAKDLTKQSLIEAVERFLHASKSDIEAIQKNNVAEFSDKYSMAICAEKYMQLYR